MIAAVSNNFWHTFLYGGFTSPPPVKSLITALTMQFGLTSLLLLLLFASTYFVKIRWGQSPDTDWGQSPNANPASRRQGVMLAIKSFVPICVAAFTLQFFSALILENVFQVTAHAQDLVEWLKPGTYPLGIRLLLMAVAVIEAPLMEELLFRGIIFRGLARSLPAGVAMALSGLVFAIVHVNAAALVPLWFLGIAFAWLYRKSGTILAPMTAHWLFNLLNLLMVLSGLAQ